MCACRRHLRVGALARVCVPMCSCICPSECLFTVFCLQGQTVSYCDLFILCLRGTNSGVLKTLRLFFCLTPPQLIPRSTLQTATATNVESEPINEHNTHTETSALVCFSLLACKRLNFVLERVCDRLVSILSIVFSLKTAFSSALQFRWGSYICSACKSTHFNSCSELSDADFAEDEAFVCPSK